MYAKRIYHFFTCYEPSSLIGKLKTDFEYYDLNGVFVITTITNKIEPNSYVVSPYGMIIDYSKDELVKIDSFVQKILSLSLIKIFASFFHFTQINKVQTLNNYLFSTNFFSKEWEDLDVKKLETLAINKYPNHALVIRSVNKVQNPKLYKNLISSGWIAVTSRQVYIFDDKEYWQKRQNTKIDRKLLSSKDYNFYEATKKKDFSEAERLYNLLYLQKYSQHNIQFKAHYLQLLVQDGLLKLYLLQDEVTKKSVGVVGMTLEDGIMTVPIVGYETNYPQSKALYRRLIAFALEYAFKKNVFLNLSSGAPEFKKLRGAKAELEYMMVKIEHLPFRQRIGWRLIAIISQSFYARLLRRLQL
jgi:hypothetical protein